jgi:hypothetical protein
MKKAVLIISLSIMPFVILAGCKMGPTKGQTRQALEAIIRSFHSSIAGLEDVEVNGTYANAADFSLQNEEGSVVTTMSIIMREDGFQIYGTSTIADYEDTKSNYIINGELTYNMWAPPNWNPHEAYGDVSCSVALSGGKIETLEFSVSGDLDGDEECDITANNYAVDLNHYESFFELFEDVAGKVRG